MLLESGIHVTKLWFSVTQNEQRTRFTIRQVDPVRQWKLSPTDLYSRTKWIDYSRAKDEMFVHTDIPEARWHIVESDVKRNARVNCISHMLANIPYEVDDQKRVKLPKVQTDDGYKRPPEDLYAYVPNVAERLLEEAESGSG